MINATHHGVVTLVRGNLLALWDLDADEPWLVAASEVLDGQEPATGSVVSIVLENGRPESVRISSEAELAPAQLRILRALMEGQEDNPGPAD